MRVTRKKSSPRQPAPRARSSHSRQRQHLIDACISALHLYGPSRTTVEKVVAIAKMSPGIVRFYFASKAAMLVASLQFLATEFEEQLLVPVGRLRSRPVAALELLVDLYLDPEIASPRKVSVWYAFWGEASSRQEYYDICGQKDEGFAALVRDLIGRLIIESSQPQLDPDGVALGLIGSLEMLWQDFAFRDEDAIDRAAAKRRVMAYLRSVFPGQFCDTDSEQTSRTSVPSGRIGAWAYEDEHQAAIERQHIFHGSWQFVCHVAQLADVGRYLAADLGYERPLLVRNEAGEVRAFRNNCPVVPHALLAGPGGHVTQIECKAHALSFDLDGRRVGGGGSDLTRLDWRQVGDLILVRAGAAPSSDSAERWAEVTMPTGARQLPAARDVAVAADWKLVLEQCLESAAVMDRVSGGWSRLEYERIVAASASRDDALSWIAPNHLIESRRDGLTIFQVLPRGVGQSCLRTHRYTVCADQRAAVVASYLASRLRPLTRRAALAVIESTQKGFASFGYPAHPEGATAADATALRRFLLSRIAALAEERPTSA